MTSHLKHGINIKRSIIDIKENNPNNDKYVSKNCRLDESNALHLLKTWVKQILTSKFI